MSMLAQGLLAALVVFAFGIGLFLLGYMSLRKDLHVMRYGYETMATVKDIRPAITEEKRFRYFFEYQIYDKSTVVTEWNVYVKYHVTKAYPVGSKMKIKYDPLKPKNIVVGKAGGMQIVFSLVALVGVALMILSMFLLFMAFKLQ